MAVSRKRFTVMTASPLLNDGLREDRCSGWVNPVGHAFTLTVSLVKTII